MCHIKSNKKCNFVDLFEFFIFWNIIHFQHRRFSPNFQKIVYFINIDILPCKPMSLVELNQKCNFVDLFNFFYFLESYSFSAQQIFIKFQCYFININILPCKLDLCATQNRTKSVILSICLDFFLLFGGLFIFGLVNFQQTSGNCLFYQY